VFHAPQADAQDLPFQTDSVDIVTCCYGYMFPEDKELALAETYRVLKPGGTLVVDDNANLVHRHNL
jgi:ubiquinone/menaquinone biosynthesis C-methylase UbiE